MRDFFLELAWLAYYGFIMQIVDGFIWENSNTSYVYMEKLYVGATIIFGLFVF